jgi:hypothetical protein
VLKGRLALAGALMMSALAPNGLALAERQQLTSQVMRLTADRPKKKNKFGNRKKEKARRQARAKQRRGR